ncbi:replication protein [Salmonella enterica]|jgi:phage replication O-like protein O|uniref:Replication protein n=2 Tax=Salmonella enterica TaxID=28901 RepID=A0A3V4A650_SALNE|nr:replication protein [Salmonella enterica]EBB7691663.1 replication protein [Salmonella enterica subsp. enterica serovar Muenchen]EBV5900553.1 replication protein [Salmonella enterica subsp. enterica serovar Hadar]EDR9085257.1 replication protein [Salmonella enterica subsp. enterica serovar Saintpaul]EDT4295014.1 replication protein [Salmonella enterica subsp. enterica serovar 4,[5],12:i:-]EEK0878729.1 replication protein [Salmonella enterica subsp. enterica serovar Typhimurium]EEO2091971.1 
MSLAEVFYLSKSEPVEQERRVADIDDGYTRFANELLEAIASADLTARQLKVMLAYVRKTYGFNKKTDRIADEQIAQLTGLSRQNVNKAKKELISMNCLFMDGNQIGVNSEVSAWQFSKCLQVSNFVSKLETKNVSKLETLNVSKLETHKRHSLKTKENINKPPISPKKVSQKFDPLETELPDWLSAETWLSWVTYRKEIGKSIKSKQSVTQAINVLSRSLEKGYTPEEIINQSIASGWQGIFEPKTPKGKSQPRPQHRAMQENFATKDYGQTEMPSWAQE